MICNKLARSATIALAMGGVPTIVFAQDNSCGDDSPITVTISGGAPRGMIAVLGEGQAAVVREAYPGSNVVYEPGSSAGALVATATGETEFGLVTAIDMKRARDGVAPFPQSYSDFWPVTALSNNRTLMHPYGRQAFLDDNGITSFRDIKERQIPVRLGINQPGNQWARAHVDATLAAYDLTLADIVSFGGELIEVSTKPTMELMRDGRADIEITGGFVPMGALLDLNNTTPVRLLVMTEEETDSIAKDLGVNAGTIPAGTYSFLDQDMPTPATTHYIIAGPKATDEQVCKLARALAVELPLYRTMHRAFSDMTRDEIVPDVTDFPLHPSAQKAYSE